MKLDSEWKKVAAILAVFLACYYLPVGVPRFDGAVKEALELVRWYAREHVLLCLIPAFFIAGAIAVFVSQQSVMRYLGPNAPKALSYGVASVSGTILAVCSCTVLPLFAGIYRMGAGIGPAAAFLYSGPAINVLAIILTARILGMELGIARAVGAVVFSVVIGLAMHFLFRFEEREKLATQPVDDGGESMRPLWHTAASFASMVAILVFANWGKPDGTGGFFAAVFGARWWLTGIAGLTLGMTLTRMAKGELGAWGKATWEYAKLILPLLLAGVFVSGLLLGRPGQEGLIPSAWVAAAVGGNSLQSNLFASVVGAFMYFATLTEVPILQGLIGNGMGKGPALALLLAGPALSLPSMLVLYSIIGLKKTATYALLVIIAATASGILFGAFFP